MSEGCAIDLSVVVASYNTRDLLRGCLASIYAGTANLGLEVIVVDDCSPDDSVEMVRNEFPQACLLVNPRNLRYAKTNNRGLRAARGRYALLLNSDTVVRPGAFEALVRFMDERPEVAAAGPKLVNSDGTVQHCIRSFPTAWVSAIQATNLHKIWPSNPFSERYYNVRFDYAREQRVESIGTTAFILRRTTWEKYGMLDERFTLAFVDLAYCRTLKLEGAQVWYTPRAEVLHYGSQTINANGRKEIRLQHEALRTFYDLYYAPAHHPVARALVRTGIAARSAAMAGVFALSRDKRVLAGPRS
jgi:GT2 family glycosyltransferase